MSVLRDSEDWLEVERYEIWESGGPLRPSRRDFLKGLGAGLLVLLALVPEGGTQESGGGRRRGGGAPAPREIGAWLHVAEDGTVTVYTGKTEVGQNIRTSLSQAVAEELRVPLASVRMLMADTDQVPFDAGTFGSQTTPRMSVQLRKAAAAAREVLVGLAAEQWQADRGTLRADAGKVTDPSGRSATYGQLTGGRKLVQVVPDDVRLTPTVEWRVAGASAPKVDGRALVTGKHQYTSDVRREGMQVGKVLRPPAFGAELVSADPAGAEAVPGAKVVRDGSFVAVTAPDEAAASRALAAIKAEWKTTPQPAASDLFRHLKENAAPARDAAGKQAVEDALAAAEVKREAAYTVAYIAHVPLEPRAAVAEWADGKMTVWTGTQRPFGVRREVAQALAIPEDRVRVIVPDTGSGYGGKHTGEAAVEAARLSKATGKPVRVLWSREEEFTWAYFRPAGLIEVRGAARKDGTLTAWEFHNYNSGGSALATPYEVPSQNVQFHGSRSPLRQGSYRALASTANVFARECFMDELAHGAGMDPLELRLKNLKEPRLRAVLQAAAERFGWAGWKAGAGRGAGIACGTEKGGYVGTCAEVEVDSRTGDVRVKRAVVAFECGAVVNPDHLKNQVEGSVVMGLGGALFEAIDFADGKIKNPKLSRYRVPRFHDMPAIEVVLVDRKDLPPAGAGEAPIIGIAPAIGNAIFSATGERRRALPLSGGR